MGNQTEKVWVVVNEFKDGTSEVVGVYSDIGEAMFQTGEQKGEDIAETYLQEHKVQGGQGNVMNLKEMSEFIESEEQNK